MSVAGELACDLGGWTVVSEQFAPVAGTAPEESHAAVRASVPPAHLLGPVLECTRGLVRGAHTHPRHTPCAPAPRVRACSVEKGSLLPPGT